MTQEQIHCLRDCELRAIVRSTNPMSDRFPLEIVWARDEIARRMLAKSRVPTSAAANLSVGRE